MKDTTRVALCWVQFDGSLSHRTYYADLADAMKDVRRTLPRAMTLAPPMGMWAPSTMMLHYPCDCWPAETTEFQPVFGGPHDACVAYVFRKRDSERR